MRRMEGTLAARSDIPTSARIAPDVRCPAWFAGLAGSRCRLGKSHGRYGRRWRSDGDAVMGNKLFYEMYPTRPTHPTHPAHRIMHPTHPTYPDTLNLLKNNEMAGVSGVSRVT